MRGIEKQVIKIGEVEEGRVEKNKYADLKHNIQSPNN